MLGKAPLISAGDLCTTAEHSMQEHRVPLRESSNLNVLKAHDQANFIHWIAWDKTACFREEDRQSLWALFLRKSSSCQWSMPFPKAGGWEGAWLQGEHSTCTAKIWGTEHPTSTTGTETSVGYPWSSRPFLFQDLFTHHAFRNLLICPNCDDSWIYNPAVRHNFLPTVILPFASK